MIEVNVEYFKTETQYDERFVYTNVEVKGHANNGDIESIKCCAGVTAILQGALPLFNQGLCDLVIRKGLFRYKEINTKNWCRGNQSALNTIIVQLYGVYRVYPHLFKSFNLREREE